MASAWFRMWGFICLCLLFGDGVQGRQLQYLEKRMEGSNQIGSNSYASGSSKAASENALHAESEEGYLKGGAISKLYNNNNNKRGLYFDKSPSVFHLYADDDPNRIFHYAQVKTFQGNYSSARIAINVYGLPEVTANQSSSAEFWVLNSGDGSPNSYNAIQAGWHVVPPLYGDHDTHFFIYWIVNGVGCYNLQCKGFVLDKSSNYVPGTRIRPLSSYNGEQSYINLKISKDPQTGDWWLHHGVNTDEPIGYWPKSLFTSLANGATNVDYGGVVSFLKNEKSPPMGSGHFPDEGYGKAASLKLVELDGRSYDSHDDTFLLYHDKDNCYMIDDVKTIYFGGPGGCTD